MQESIVDENELMNRVVELNRWSGFSKVHQISTVKLSPDIDFLRIPEVGTTRITIGYEFKLIKYNKAWKKANLMRMYTGVGEAFHYFQFGVDQSCLVLGLSDKIPPNALDNALKKIREYMRTFISLKELFTYVGTLTVGFKCFGAYIWNERNNVFVQAVKATGNFRMTEENKHLKQCLLRGQFKYDKKFRLGSIG